MYVSFGYAYMAIVAFLDTAHYLVTKHSRKVRLTLFVAVTARVYLSRDS